MPLTNWQRRGQRQARGVVGVGGWGWGRGRGLPGNGGGGGQSGGGPCGEMLTNGRPEKAKR